MTKEKKTSPSAFDKSSVDKSEDKEEKSDSKLKKLLSDKTYLTIPATGDIVKGKVIFVSKREIRIDVEGFRTGIIRGRELSDDPSLSNVEVGEEIEATVVELENENGEIELSLRSAGQRRAWDRIQTHKDKKDAVVVCVTEANKGGLIGSFEGVQGFLPVSQLSPENYPRVSGGDKAKILEKLRSFIGQKLNVKILDADEDEQKLIFSEKNLWEEEQKTVIEKYKIGDMVEGEISALADFGAFVKFNDLEGLIHISEIAWQRIDHPSDLLKTGQKVKAEIVGIEGSKIFLSMKKLEDDPWKDINKKYKAGQMVKGKILKINPFGFFVELDDAIHGLAHVSELGLQFGKKPEDIAKPGDEKEFRIISIEPEYHRLGLSLRAMKDDGKNVGVEKLQPKKEPKEDKKSPEPKDKVEASSKDDAKTPTESGGKDKKVETGLKPVSAEKKVEAEEKKVTSKESGNEAKPQKSEKIEESQPEPKEKE